MIDYKALAERLSRLADELAAFGHHTSEQRVDDLRTVVSLLKGMAEAKPFAWMDEFGNAFPLDAWKPAKRTGYLDYHKKAWKPLFTHPAPQPQPEHRRRTEQVTCGCGDEYPVTSFEAGYICAVGQCPNCDMKPSSEPFDSADDLIAHLHGQCEPTEAQIKARDALLDFISENGTASEGVQHYLDRYVRAALAARETK